MVQKGTEGRCQGREAAKRIARLTNQCDELRAERDQYRKRCAELEAELAANADNDPLDMVTAAG